MAIEIFLHIEDEKYKKLKNNELIKSNAKYSTVDGIFNNVLLNMIGKSPSDFVDGYSFYNLVE